MATSSFDKKFVVQNQETADKLLDLIYKPSPSTSTNESVTTAKSRDDKLKTLKDKWAK